MMVNGKAKAKKTSIKVGKESPLCPFVFDSPYQITKLHWTTRQSRVYVAGREKERQYYLGP